LFKPGREDLAPRDCTGTHRRATDGAQVGRCEGSAERVRGRDPLVVGPVSTEKGVPGDGDALLIGSPRFYFVIVPHAMRSPALPAGSDFMSSALA
jgi:hypothetical protein